MDLSSVNELNDFILNINAPILVPLDQDGVENGQQSRTVPTAKPLTKKDGLKKVSPLEKSLHELNDVTHRTSIPPQDVNVLENEQKEAASLKKTLKRKNEDKNKAPPKKRSHIEAADDDSVANVQHKPAKTPTAKNKTKRKTIEERSKEACICPECNKAFSSGRTLRTHLVTHQKVRPFLCDQCQKRFQTKQNLQNHKNVHLGLKPHKCTHCSKLFAEKSTLAKHQLTHSKKKPHACTFCEKRFTQTRSLQKHTNRCHKNEGEIVFPWIGEELVEKAVWQADFEECLDGYNVEGNKDLSPLDFFN